MRKVYKHSVLNTDAFDKRRFNELFNLSKGLQAIEKEGSQLLPTFGNLLGDTWSSLYKMNPEVKEEIPESIMANRSFLNQVMGDDSFAHSREFTKLDDLMAAITTVNFGEKTKGWMEEQERENEAFKKALEEARQAHQQLKDLQNKRQWAENREERKKSRQKANQQMNQAMQDLAGQIRGNQKAFQNMLTAALQEAKETKEDLKSLASGMQAGSGNMELKKMPLRHQLELAEHLKNHKKLKEIAQWAGRFTKIARSKQKENHRESIERSGVTFGNQVERLLPMELSLLSAPHTKLDFLRRFAEGETMLYEQTGKETLGQGPIILCLDQSGSMKDLDTQSKGFALALMSIAKKQKRDFAIVRFSTKAFTTEYPKGKYTVDQMINLASDFLGGGTNFRPPLNEALSLIEKSRYEKADIIFVTDGDAHMDDEFIQRFNEEKERKKFSVMGILIGGVNDSTVSRFADKIIHTDDFMNASQAFKI